MFFKRIEFVGFKSFATKTHVDLIPGVTVVVGPNGCGKSNILDAVKWVLGDQSAKSLRGKKMQDVIFAGSASFKPLGMAQVTLTLDNSKRILDLDFDEVQIARRLYRTGESEYLMNKVPCRLKDIHDIFLGTGVGTTAYSILEQGKVDKIINAKPAERRFIIEEAAGISKYKVRKLECLRKLERTSTDLQRLDDLVSEIERQVNSLKRQASKAERYKETSTALAQAEKELLVLRSSGLRTELKSMSETIKKLEDQVEKLSADYAKASTEEQQGRERADAMDSDLTQRGSELYSTKSRITELEHQIERLKDKQATAAGRVEQIEAEFTELQEREGELGSRIAELDERRQQAETQALETQKNFEEKKRRYEELESEVQAEAKRLEELSRQVETQRDALSRCENDIRIAQTLIERHRDTETEVQSEIDRLQESVNSHRDRQARLEAERGELAGQLAEARRTVDSLQIQHADARAKLAEERDELDGVRKDLHHKQARLSALEELKASFEGFFKGVRDIMERANAGGLSGVIGPLAGAIKSTAPEYEQALEAALGSHVQDVLVDDLAAARAAMDFLVAEGSGRATFWPLAEMAETAGAGSNGAQVEAVRGRDGVLGYAPELIRHEDRLGGVIRALFSGTVIVRDLETAAGLAKEFTGLTWVTPEGQLLQAAGSLTGGSAETTGLLGREREIEELQRSVEELEGRERDLLARGEMNKAQAEELQGKSDAARSRHHELQVAQANLDKDFENAKQAFAESSTRLERSEAQLQHLVGEIGTKTAEIATKGEERERIQAELESTSRQLEHERERARAHSEDFLARGSELAEARAEIGKVRERIEHLTENRAGLQRELNALGDAAAQRLNEKDRLLKESAGAGEEIDGIRAQLQDLFGKRDELSQNVAERESARDELRHQLKQCEMRMEEIQRDERIAQNELQEQRVRHAEFQASLNHLSEQAEEKFGHTLPEIAEALGEVEKDAAALGQEVAEMRGRIERMGAVNLAALEEYEEQNQRLEFLTTQRKDLIDSKEQLESSIEAIDETTKRLFHETFESVRGHFIEMFRRLFNGGKADLVIEQEGDDPLLDGGIEIYAQPPGKKLQSITLMSGGEKAMTAISLLFGLFLHKPAPFAILDEIDAPLDDANVERFKNVVAEFAQDIQFIIISHNKQTMALADALYGVTMEESGVSKLVSVRFEHADQYLTSAG